MAASNAYKTSSPLLVLPPAANGVSVTPSGVSDGWSSWVELDASAAVDMRVATILAFPGVRENGNFYEAELGIGGSGSEVTVASVRGYSGDPNGGPADANDVIELPVPCDLVTAGDRLSVRLKQVSTATTAWKFSIQYWARPLADDTNMPVSQTGPVNVPAGSRLTVTSGATSSTYGSWVEVTSAADADWLIGNLTYFGARDHAWTLEIGIGAAASEVTYWTVRSMTNYFFGGNAYQGGPYNILLRPLLGPVPSGARLAIRIKSTATLTAFPFGLTVLKQLVSGAYSALPLKVYPDVTIATVAGGPAFFTPWNTIVDPTTTDVAVTGVFRTSPAGGLGGAHVIQLATGAPGSEQIFAQYFTHTAIWGGGQFYFTTAIARRVLAGERIALRYSSAGVGSGVDVTFGVHYQEISTGLPDFENWSDNLIQSVYLDANNPYTCVTAASAWVSGAWSEVDASTLVNRVITAYLATTATPFIEFEIDVGTGSAGNEEVVFTLRVGFGSTEGTLAHRILPIPQTIAAGSRLVIRGRSSSSAAVTIGAALHYTAEPVGPTPDPPDPLPGTTTFQIRRVRRTPTIFSDGKRVLHRRLQIEMQPGVGTVATPDPKVAIRTSDNGGLTWSSVRELGPGSVGQYQKLMRLFQLGSAYNRVYEVSVSDPVAWCLVNAYLDLDGARN